MSTSTSGRLASTFDQMQDYRSQVIRRKAHQSIADMLMQHRLFQKAYKVSDLTTIRVDLEIDLLRQYPCSETQSIAIAAFHHTIRHSNEMLLSRCDTCQSPSQDDIFWLQEQPALVNTYVYQSCIFTGAAWRQHERHSRQLCDWRQYREVLRCCGIALRNGDGKSFEVATLRSGRASS